jgi:hypothetical protein
MDRPARAKSVDHCSYAIHTKKDGSGLPTLRVGYCCDGDEWFNEWICFEHGGIAGKKAAKWWRLRSGLPVPQTVADAVEIAKAGQLTEPNWILVDESGEFPRITRVGLPEGPDTSPDPAPAAPAVDRSLVSLLAHCMALRGEDAVRSTLQALCAEPAGDEPPF